MPELDPIRVSYYLRVKNAGDLLNANIVSKIAKCETYYIRDKGRGIRPCIPGRKSRNKVVRYDKRRYRRQNRIERMFGRLKDWRRVSTRYDRCPKVFLSAIALAATVIFCYES